MLQREKVKKQFSFIPLSVVLIPFVFLLLADLIIGDYELFLFVNQGIVNSALDFACVYAFPLIFSVFYILTLVTLCFSRDSASMASGVISLITGPLSYGIGSMIKLLFGRPRPFDVLSGVRVIGLWHSDSFSFPSTTTMLALGFTLPILFEKHRYGVVLVVLSYFIAFSVVYAGFHFPADVLAGILLSLGITICTNRMKNPIESWFHPKNVSQLLAPGGPLVTYPGGYGLVWERPFSSRTRLPSLIGSPQKRQRGYFWKVHQDNR